MHVGKVVTTSMKHEELKIWFLLPLVLSVNQGYQFIMCINQGYQFIITSIMNTAFTLGGGLRATHIIKYMEYVNSEFQRNIT